MLRRIELALLAMLLLVACSGQGPASVGPTAPAALPQPTATGAQQREITVAMPYIPNVQFAQFYLAAQKGYYAAEGLKVKFDYNFETDVVQRAAQGSVQFAMASGDSVLLARAQGLPIVTVATTSQRFATVFFSK